MADQFKNFNRLAEACQQYPMLAPFDLEDRFKNVDRLLDAGLRTLLDTTHFVEDNLCHRLAEIATGSIKTKIYRGRFVKRYHGAGQGVMVGAENSRVLGLGFDLFKLSRISRDLAVPLVLRVLRSLRLQNINYEQILRAFADITTDYRQLCVQLASEQQQLKAADERGDRDLVVRMKSISDLIDQKKRTESRAGCVDSNVLYGTVAIIHRFVQRINIIQTQITNAYMRSIPRVVRQYAESDLNASDMFQAGCFGLMHAVKAYDYRSRAGFAGFSRRWIRQRIQSQMKESGGPLIRLSPSVWKNYHEILRAEAWLKSQQQHDEVSRKDIATHLGWALDKVDSIYEKVSLCQIVSLDDDTRQDTDEYVEREASIADTADEDQELLQQQQEQVRQIVENLGPKDRRLICLRFGCIELIDNDNIDPTEALNEIFRQLACKMLVHQYVAGRIDSVQSLPIVEMN